MLCLQGQGKDTNLLGERIEMANKSWPASLLAARAIDWGKRLHGFVTTSCKRKVK